MNIPKNQHWVPQFYLRFFATQETRETNQPQVWIFSANPEDGDETLTSIRNVCTKRYLYSPNTSGARTWDLERKLGSIEGALAQVWPALATGYMDLADSTLRKGVSLFVALLHLRHPNMLEVAQQAHREVVSLFGEMPRKADGTPDVSYVKVKGEVRQFDASDWHAYRAWGKDDHHRAFVRLIQSEATHIAEILMAKRWSMIVAEHDTFITSDKPVAIQHPERRTCGVRTPGSLVFFPVSPTRLLVMDDMHAEPANRYYPLAISAVGAHNFNIWYNGSRFMITGRPVLEVLAEFVEWGDSLGEHEA